MARGIPSNIIRKLYSKNVDSAFLTILTIYADGQILRLVDNQTDIEYKGLTYSASHFTIVYPDDSPDIVPMASVVFADIGNTLFGTKNTLLILMPDIPSIVKDKFRGITGLAFEYVLPAFNFAEFIIR